MGFSRHFNQAAVDAHYREELRKGTNLYGSTLSQTERFRNVLRYFDFDGKDTLDIGCGKGDFLWHLWVRGQRPSSYIGIDPLTEMIDKINEQLRHTPTTKCIDGKGGEWTLDDNIPIRLFCGDYLDVVNTETDIAVAFSVFDKKFGNFADSKGYMWQMIEKMIYDAEEGIYVTFLSAYKTINDFSEALFYPTDVYKYARSFAERVVIDSSYMPHAFSLIVYNRKSPWRVEWEKK